MGRIADITVPARRSGISGADCGKKIKKEIGEVNFDELVEAFAYAGYPPSDSIKGIFVALGTATKIKEAVAKYYAEGDTDSAMKAVFPEELL